MNAAWKEQDRRPPETTENDGIVVWDHKGIVVRWPDGHSSRFSWSALRQACQCDECHTFEREPATRRKKVSQKLPHSGEERRRALH